MTNENPIVSGAKDIAEVIDRSERWLRLELKRQGSQVAQLVRRDDGGRLYALREELLRYVDGLPRGV